MRLVVQWQDPSREPHAGQFYMLRAWAADATPILSRPISVDDFDHQTGALTFLYQVKVSATTAIAALAQHGEKAPAVIAQAVEAAQASGKRLDDSQRQMVARADRDPACCGLAILLRKGRIEMERGPAGVSVRVLK